MTRTRRTLSHGAFILIPCAVLLSAALGCFGDGIKDRAASPLGPAPVSLATLGIAPDSVSLVPGAFAQFQAAFQDAGGKRVDDPEVQWYSADTTIAIIDNSGRVTAMAPGETWVTAALADKTASAHVLVVESMALRTRK
jgi:Big-like domain-containing protein